MNLLLIRDESELQTKGTFCHEENVSLSLLHCFSTVWITRFQIYNVIGLVQILIESLVVQCLVSVFCYKNK